MRNPIKGLLHGGCFRGACTNHGATWYSTVEQQYYCKTCAERINEFLPQGVAKIVDIPKLHKMFVQINKDCAETDQSVVAFNDIEFYSDQIVNLEIMPNDTHGLRLAVELNRFDQIGIL